MMHDRPAATTNVAASCGGRVLVHRRSSVGRGVDGLRRTVAVAGRADADALECAAASVAHALDGISLENLRALDHRARLHRFIYHPRISKEYRHEQRHQISRRVGCRKNQTAARWLALAIAAFRGDRHRLWRRTGRWRCATLNRPTTRTSAATSCRSRRRFPARSVAIGADDTQFVKRRPDRWCSSTEADARSRSTRPEAQLAQARCAKSAACSRRPRTAAPPRSPMRQAGSGQRQRGSGAPRASRELGRCFGRGAAARARRVQQRASGACSPRNRSWPRTAPASIARPSKTTLTCRTPPRTCARRTSPTRAPHCRRRSPASSPNARCNSANASSPGAPLMADRAARPGLGRRQFQGTAACRDARRASR